MFKKCSTRNYENQAGASTTPSVLLQIIMNITTGHTIRYVVSWIFQRGQRYGPLAVRQEALRW